MQDHQKNVGATKKTQCRTWLLSLPSPAFAFVAPTLFFVGPSYEIQHLILLYRGLEIIIYSPKVSKKTGNLPP